MPSTLAPVATSSLHTFYNACLDQPRRAMTAHLPRLRDLAVGLPHAVEFGVKHGASSAALLMGATRVTSYDIVETASARRLQQLAPWWDYRIADSLTVTIPDCDLLLLDSLHTCAQVDAELTRHADRVGQYLVFHDTITFGSIGADGESGQWSWTPVVGQSVPYDHLGIRHAIDRLMLRDRSWQIHSAYPDSHGLLVLERRT